MNEEEFSTYSLPLVTFVNYIFYIEQICYIYVFLCNAG